MPNMNPLDANGSILRLNDNFTRGAASGLALDAPPRRRPLGQYDPSPSPAMGLDMPAGPSPQISQQIAQQKNAAAQAKFRGQAFDETWDNMTPDAKAAFKPAGMQVGQQADLYGSFPVEYSPGNQNPGVYKAADASGPRDAANIEGNERANALPAFQRSLDLRSAGAPPIPPSPAHAQTIDALQNQLLLEKMKNGPPAPGMQPAAVAPAAQPASNINLGAVPPGNFDVSRYVPADQAFAQNAGGSIAPAPQSGDNIGYLKALYQNAQTPGDRNSILKTIAAAYGDSAREAVASTTAQSRENVASTGANSRQAVASTTADSREAVADKNNSARKEMEGMKLGELEKVAQGNDATKRDIATNLLQERYADLGSKERHWQTLSDEARGRAAAKGQLTPEDVARYRGEFDKINATREVHGLNPHPYPDYLAAASLSPGMTMQPTTMVPGATPAAQPAAPIDPAQFSPRPDGLFEHPGIPGVTYRKVPGGYQRVQ